MGTFRQIITAAVFVVIIGVFFVLNIITPSPDILISERRLPSKMPEINFANLSGGHFADMFESYAADRFVFRDSFRTLRALTVFYVYWQTDKSGLYFGESGAGEFRPIDALSVRQTAERIKRVAESDIFNGANIHYSFIPDKSIYAGRKLPGFDVDMTEEIMCDVLSVYTYVPLAGHLNAQSFYRTDIHWDQPNIIGTASYITGAMGRAAGFDSYTKQYAGPFNGVYGGQLALFIPADELHYMENEHLRAELLNTNTLEYESCEIYDMEAFHGLDPYDIFLHGAQAIIRIENPNAPEGDLYLFRDSFGSSMAPLLASAYRNVVVIDLRFIDIRILGQYIDVKPGSDVLFLYSSQILNNPSILRV